MEENCEMCEKEGKKTPATVFVHNGNGAVIYLCIEHYKTKEIR